MSLTVRKDNTEEVVSEFSKAFDRALERIGSAAERYARNLAPKQTGRLQNSITHAVDNEEAVYIGTNVEYAPYVELGTSRQDPQPFLTPAASDHGDEYRSILESELKGS